MHQIQIDFISGKGRIRLIRRIAISQRIQWKYLPDVQPALLHDINEFLLSKISNAIIRWQRTGINNPAFLMLLLLVRYSDPFYPHVHLSVPG